MTSSIWRVDGISLKRSQFFLRIIHSAFRELPFVIDGDASMVEATKFALKNGSPIHQAIRNAAALREIHRSGVRASEDLAAIENVIFERRLVDQDAALLLTLEWLKERRELPVLLADIEEIRFESVFDFTRVELEILFRLAELSLRMKFVLPIDFQARDLLAPIQFLLAQLELRAVNLPITIETPQIDLPEAMTPFFNGLFVDGTQDTSNAVRVALPNQFESQIDWVCSEVSRLRAIEPRAKIAVGFRTLDSRLRRFEEAFTRRRLPCKMDMKVPLKELPEMKSLVRKLANQLETGTGANFSSQLDECIAFLDESSSASFFNDLKERFMGEDCTISRHDFFYWLKAILERRDVGLVSPSDADAIEFVSVKQLWWRSYDYVFLPDLAQGRFPKAESVLDSAWFVGAIKSAHKGLFLSSSTLDPKGREQAPSEFLSAALRVVGADTQSPSKRRSMLRPIASNSVKLDPARAREVFQRWLGLDKHNPLTATRLEGFAMCPFRTLVQRIFGVDDKHGSDVDLDARAVGRFVHAVLETFFRSSVESRQSLHAIIESKKHMLSEEDQVSPLIIEANLSWLTLILERTVSNLLKNPPSENSLPTYFEHAVGFDSPQSVVAIGQYSLYLAGIIDRVDIGKDAVAIVDYKLSTMSMLRQRANEKALLESHFQMPLYLRVLLEQHPELRDKEISAFLISVRDGSIMRLKGDLKGRAIHDERDDSLSTAINRVMAPVLEGKFEPQKNENCPSCYLKQVCRA